MTTATGVLSLAGPRARDVLQAVTDSDVSHRVFPFATHQTMWIGHAETQVQRLSYTGALGYEIFVTPDWAEHVFDTLVAAGAARGVADIQAYRHGEASVMGVIAYLRLVLIGGAGYFMFAETPDAATLLGGAIIIGATLYIAQREARLRRLRRGPKAGPAD